MGIQDESDKEAQLAHIHHLLTNYTDMVVLGETGISAETRQMAQREANQYAQHIWDDLVFLVKGELPDIPAETPELDKDFQMWADELK